MLTPTLASWSLIGAALLLSICALFAALRSSARSQLRRLAVLSAQLSDLDETVAELARALNREQSRQRMRELRTRRKVTENGAPAGDAGRPMTEAEKDEWQREMNYKIATGQVRLGPGR